MLAMHYHHGKSRGFNRIMQRQWNFMSGQQISVIRRRIITWLAFIMRGEIQRRAKFHYEAAAMAGDEVARNNIGTMEVNFGNMEQAVKHWTVAASAGNNAAMKT
jgi:hypothetical protein